MTAQRPGVRHTNNAKVLLNRLDLSETSYDTDIAAAQAYALTGLAEALGELVLAIRSGNTTKENT